MIYNYKIPKWIENLFPEDLINALDEELTKPKKRGRTTSIDADNVNDFAYYTINGKKAIYDYLKGNKKITPHHYSGEKKNTNVMHTLVLK